MGTFQWQVQGAADAKKGGFCVGVYVFHYCESLDELFHNKKLKINISL